MCMVWTTGSRDLMLLLGYKRWSRFVHAIEDAKEALREAE
jgi:hypothetical protein